MLSSEVGKEGGNGEAMLIGWSQTELHTSANVNDPIVEEIRDDHRRYGDKQTENSQLKVEEDSYTVILYLQLKTSTQLDLYSLKY